MGNMIHLRFFVFGTALLIVLCLLLKTLASSGSQAQRTSAAHIPRKIWQKWETPVQGLGEELMRLSKSWIDMNPDHRYELLTGDSSLTYVRERYEQYPDIIEVFEQTTDGILRADLIRYLTLLSDGGVYTDIDTDCSRPIGEWIPKDLAEQTGLLLGIEYDSQGGEIRKDFNIPTQLCQWTLMARPGHPVLQHVVDRVVEKLLADVRVKDNVTSHDLLYVLETTGPRVSAPVSMFFGVFAKIACNRCSPEQYWKACPCNSTGEFRTRTSQILQSLQCSATYLFSPSAALPQVKTIRVASLGAMMNN